MEPLVFTLSLFKEEIRQRAECWRPLGFVPQFRKSSSALERVEKQSKTSAGRLVRNYHRILDTLLAGIVECQNSPPIVRLRLGNEWKFVRVNIIMEALLGDALSNDVICGRVQSRRGTLRLCRACHVPQSDSHDTRHRCKFLVQRHIERITLSALGPDMDPSNPNYFNQWDAFVNQMVAKAEYTTNSQKQRLRHKYETALLKRKSICTEILRVVLGSHVVDNAFYRLNSGNNPRGIFGSAATDPMHAVEEGIIPNFVDVIIGPLPDSAKKKLDCVVESLFSKSSNRSSQRADYPRISFSGGYSSLTQLSADEKVGKLFALAIVAETPVGREILQQRCNPEFDSKRKERATRFKKVSLGTQTILDPLEGDEEDQPTLDENEPMSTEHEEAEVNRFSKMKYDPKNEDHSTFVESQLQVHGLSYMLPFLSQMSKRHSMKAHSIIWNLTRSLIKNSSFSTDQVQIPNAGDVLFAVEWRRCADRRTTLHSNLTSHPDSIFYAPNLVEINSQQMVDDTDDHEELPLPKHSIDCASADDLIEIIQLVLAFHAFYKYGAPLFGNIGLEVIDTKVRNMLLKLQSSVDRGEGTLGWAISKFHDILHMAIDMQLFGASTNVDTSKGEHGLKIWAKLPSRTTQTTHGANKFIEQLGYRLYEQTLIDKAYSVLVPNQGNKPSTRSELELPTFAINFQTKTSFRINGKFKKHKNQNIELGNDLIEWFCGPQNKVANRKGIYVFARMFLAEYGDLTFRASPDYLGTGPWYDWVLVDFIDSNDRRLHYPFKILGFVQKDDKSGPVCFGQMGSMQSANEKHDSSIGLFEHWHLEVRHTTGQPVFRFVEIDSILEHCLAFQLTENSIDAKSTSTIFTKRVLIVKNRQKVWPEIFLHGIGKKKQVKKTTRKRKKRR
jgi:hypothetical protein